VTSSWFFLSIRQFFRIWANATE